jgi:DNA-binding transcriptional regulator YbjK
MSRSLLWSRTRQAVRDAIGALASSDFSVARAVTGLGPLAQEVEAEPHASVEAFGELVERGDFRERTLAALFVLRIGRWHPPLVRPSLLALARDRLVEGVTSKSDDDRVFACTTLTIGYVPTECIRALFNLMSDGDGVSRYAAAAALSIVDPDEIIALAQNEKEEDVRARGYELSFSHAVLTLTAGMRCEENDAIRGMCAAALVRLLPESHRTLQEVIGVLSTIEGELKYGVLVALKHAGARSDGVLATLAALTAERDLPSAVRGCAAETLGMLTEGSDRGSSALLAALASTDALVARGAMLGIGHAGMMPAKAVEQYISLLSADQEDLRIVAMQGLAALRATSPEAIEALVARIGRESGREATQALIAALAAVGAAAIPPLLKIIEMENVNALIVASLALASIGVDGGSALFDAARRDASAPILESLVGVFMQIGPAGAPLVPQLVDELETSNNGEMLAACVACIYWTQSKDAAAAVGLVGALLYAADEVATLAERALRVIGTAAIPALKQALAESLGGRVERVTDLLRELSGLATTERSPSEPLRTRVAVDDPRFERFRAFGDDRQLMTFVYVARIWAKEGPMPLRRVAAVLEQRELGGTITPGYKLKFRTVSDHVKTVCDKWTDPPLRTVQNRRAGGLTEAGRIFLADLEAYFQTKYGRPLG